MTVSQQALAEQAQQRRAAAASLRDRVAFTSNGHGPSADSRVAQLNRRIDKDRGIIASLNAIPKYHGVDPVKRRADVQHNLNAHVAQLRLERCVAARDALLSA